MDSGTSVTAYRCLPAAVVAVSVASPARRWKKVWRRFQPMMPSHSSTSRRRSSEPCRVTRAVAGQGVPQGSVAIRREHGRDRDGHDGGKAEPERSTGRDGHSGCGNQDERRQQGAHETTTPSSRAMGSERDLHRSRVPQDLGSDVPCHRARGRRQQQRAAAVGAAPGLQTRRDAAQARRVDGPQQQRLGELDSPQPSFLDAGGPGRQQPAGDVEAALSMAREAKTPVGQDIAADRQDCDEGDERDQPLQDVQPDRGSLQVVEGPLTGPTSPAVTPSWSRRSPPDAEDRRGTQDPRHGERREAHPPGSSRASSMSWPPGVTGSPAGTAPKVTASGASKVTTALRWSSSARKAAASAAGSESSDSPLPRVVATGADVHLREPQEPVQRRRGHVNAADPIRWRGNGLALQQTGAQLHLLRGDAVSGGRPAQHAQRNDPDDTQRTQPPQLPVADRATRHDQANEGGDGSGQLPDGVDQQHPGAQTAPGRSRSGAGHAHVASPSLWLVTSVSSATRPSAVARSSPWIRSGPAADAVVTVTFASLNSCSNGPRSMSTV